MSRRRRPTTSRIPGSRKRHLDTEAWPIVYHEIRFAGARVQFVIRRDDL
jgi:hypothetical protein